MKVRRTKPFGPKGLTGSEPARRSAAIVLESLSGACGPVEAARGLGVALARYYQLEARVLQAIVSALEPRPRGRQVGAEASARKSQAERRRLERDLHRYQALYRAAQKTLGIGLSSGAAAEEKGAKKKKGRMRRVTRGERVAAGLRASASPTEESASLAPRSSGP